MTKKEIEWEYVPEIDLSYLKQPDEVYNIKHSEQYIYHTDNTNHYRRIFYNVEYTDFEKKHQKMLQEQIERENIQLPPDWDDAQTLKYCYSGGFDLKKSIEFLKLHLEWRQNPVYQRLNKQALTVLEQGVFYHLGRDKQFRPIIVLNMWQVDPKKTPLEVYLSAICNILIKVANIEFVKGHVESWVVILETNEKGITDLEIGTITKIVQIMAKNFTSTLEKMFIMNPSFLFSGAWSIIKNIIHPETAAKINILKKKDFHILQNFIDADQLEEKYGGTIPNKVIYWPPQNTLKQTQNINNNSKNKLNIPDEGVNGNGKNLDQSSYVSFKSIDNDSSIFFNQSSSQKKRLNYNHPNNHNVHHHNNDNNQYEEEIDQIPQIDRPISSHNSDSCCKKCHIF